MASSSNPTSAKAGAASPESGLDRIRRSNAATAAAAAAKARASDPKVAAKAKATDPASTAAPAARFSAGALKASASDPKAHGKATSPTRQSVVSFTDDVKAKQEADPKAKTANPTPATGSEMVWCEIDGAGEWAPCKVLTRQPDGGVTLKIKNKDVVVRPQDVAAKILPRKDQDQLTDNLVELHRDGLGSEGIEDVLRQQVCRGLPYTRIADVVLAVNPMRDMPIYDAKWVDKYAELKPSLPPHVYSASAMAYKALTEKKISQAIVLTGRPGSGKSQAMEHLLTFLAQTAGSDPVDEMLKYVGVVLRPFISIGLESGDLKWLSTRALLKIELGFDEDDFICKATASVQLLESRAARPGEGANFDAFSRALRDRTESKKWLADQEEFKLLEEGFDLEEYDKDGKELEQWKKALKIFKIESAEIVRYLCGLLLLGQVVFSNPAGKIVCSGHEQAAKALGVAATELAEELVRPGDIEAAEGKVKDTIEVLYRSLLAWVLQKVNAAMTADSQDTALTMTLMDAPAFPSGWPATLTAPARFDAVQLQWFTEALKSDLLTAVYGNVQDGSPKIPSPEAAEGALEAIGGPSGLIEKIRELSKESRPSMRSAFEQWSTQFGKENDAVSVKQSIGADEVRCTIRGSAGTVEHVLDSALVVGSLGPAIPPDMRQALTKSSFKTVQEVLGAKPAQFNVRNRGTIVDRDLSDFLDSSAGPSERSDLEEAVDAVSSIQGLLQGRERVRPWLVCCLRPNDKGSDKLVSQSVLQSQVEELLLVDMIRLAAQTSTTTTAQTPTTTTEGGQNLNRALRSSSQLGAATEVGKSGQPDDKLPPSPGLKKLGQGQKPAENSSKGLSSPSKELKDPKSRYVKSRTVGTWSPNGKSGESDEDILNGKPRRRGPLRSMVLPQHAALHSALTQMAAVLRVAKENETTLHKSKSSRNVELQDLRQECNAWHAESDRLWLQVKELEQLVGSNKNPKRSARSPARFP